MEVVAGFVEGTSIEFEPNDGEDDDGEEEEEGDVDEGSDGFGYGGHDHLQTWDMLSAHGAAINRVMARDTAELPP